MNLNLLLENITNPALLFFVLGLLSVRFKSDLKIQRTPLSLFHFTCYLLLVSKEVKN